MKASTVAASVLAIASSAAARTFTVYNNCPFTIWPALFTDLNVGSATPSQPTGWAQNAYQSIASLNVLITDAHNGVAVTVTSRPTPDRTAAWMVDATVGSYVTLTLALVFLPRETLAEFTLSASSGLDYYDVSLVDGYNLPVKITNNAGCDIANCGVDLGPNCPAALKGPYDSSGFPVGCKSDCLVDPNPGNSPSCCSGSHNTPATCPPSGVPNYSYFKNNCPNSYVYAYDESSGTALWTCPSSSQPNYTVTFCP
ncbi:hypothetical protein FRB94_000995 [Tulasnella sp. JGI-2019a]|nr:hypothetical protein FRB94_000995 [Tulasnella sp. JGI-2019a]